MSASCCSCLDYCCPAKDKQRYTQVDYKSPKKANIAVEMPEIPQVPLEKIFEYPQQRSEFPIHPQMVQKGIITKQPVTLRQRSMGVASDSISEKHRSRLSSEGSERRTGILRKKASETDSRKSSTESLQRYPGEEARASRPSEGSIDSIEGARDSVKGSIDEGPPILTTRKRTNTGDWTPSLPAIRQLVVSPEEKETLPTLQFSLYYDVQRQVLTVHLYKATNLPAKDRRGTSDPFVVAYMEPNKVEICQSKIMYKTLNPNFDEMFEFKNLTSDEVRQQTIVFRVYDHDKYSKNDFIGAVLMPLSEADLFGVTMIVKIDEEADSFRSVTKGDLLLSLNYVPDRGEIQGMVLKATNLQKQDIIGLADPYVKINLMYEGKRRAKWKTSIKRNTLLPIFNETFVFDVSSMDVRDITMEIAVMDYDRFSRNDIMGTVHIGENVGQESGKAHWAQMMSSARTSVSQWHPIMPPASQ